METSLHQSLKTLYATDGAATEVRLGRFRIDVVRGDELVEIQHAPLASIRDKIRTLLDDHPVRIVKPIVASRLLVRRASKRGKVVSRRMSPKRGTILDVFAELVHFTRVFPHPRLVLEVVLVDIEEWRYPGHGRRRWRRSNDQVTADQRLLGVRETHELRTAQDLIELVRCPLADPFHTGHLAEGLQIHRHEAQRIAYCLRQTGAAIQVGKARNALLYRFAA